MNRTFQIPDEVEKALKLLGSKLNPPLSAEQYIDNKIKTQLETALVEADKIRNADVLAVMNDDSLTIQDRMRRLREALGE